MLNQKITEAQYYTEIEMVQINLLRKIYDMKFSQLKRGMFYHVHDGHDVFNHEILDVISPRRFQYIDHSLVNFPDKYIPQWTDERPMLPIDIFLNEKDAFVGKKFQFIGTTNLELQLYRTRENRESLTEINNIASIYKDYRVLNREITPLPTNEINIKVLFIDRFFDCVWIPKHLIKHHDDLEMILNIFDSTFIGVAKLVNLEQNPKLKFGSNDDSYSDLHFYVWSDKSDFIYYTLDFETPLKNETK